MTESNVARWWEIGWELRTFSMTPREQTRILRRVTWARHRRERAQRAELAGAAVCWYCERPGHDDAPCPMRSEDAETWVAWGEEARRRSAESGEEVAWGEEARRRSAESGEEVAVGAASPEERFCLEWGEPNEEGEIKGWLSGYPDTTLAVIQLWENVDDYGTLTCAFLEDDSDGETTASPRLLKRIAERLFWQFVFRVQALIIQRREEGA